MPAAEYSGGTIPTGWAIENVKTYAPELNIVGATIGRVAMADLKAVLIKNNAQVSAGLIGAAFPGFASDTLVSGKFWIPRRTGSVAP